MVSVSPVCFLLLMGFIPGILAENPIDAHVKCLVLKKFDNNLVPCGCKNTVDLEDVGKNGIAKGSLTTECYEVNSTSCYPSTNILRNYVTCCFEKRCRFGISQVLESVFSKTLVMQCAPPEKCGFWDDEKILKGYGSCVMDKCKFQAAKDFLISNFAIKEATL
ncbi:hypothetical protein XENTR_v10023502 [Xenopus tropicalis]|nr:hypothetical protein XENTR_v10023502 [Xenopus tropicalis]